MKELITDKKKVNKAAKIHEIISKLDPETAELFQMNCDAKLSSIKKVLTKIQAGANVEIMSLHGVPLFFDLLSRNDFSDKIVDPICSIKTLNANLQNKDGNTIIMYILSLGVNKEFLKTKRQIKTIETFLKKGVDLHIKNKKGEDAFSLIKMKMKSEPQNKQWYLNLAAKMKIVADDTDTIDITTQSSSSNIENNDSDCDLMSFESGSENDLHDCELTSDLDEENKNDFSDDLNDFNKQTEEERSNIFKGRYSPSLWKEINTSQSNFVSPSVGANSSSKL